MFSICLNVLSLLLEEIPDICGQIMSGWVPEWRAAAYGDTSFGEFSSTSCMDTFNSGLESQLGSEEVQVHVDKDHVLWLMALTLTC